MSAQDNRRNRNTCKSEAASVGKKNHGASISRRLRPLSKGAWHLHVRDLLMYMYAPIR